MLGLSIVFKLTGFCFIIGMLIAVSPLLLSVRCFFSLFFCGGFIAHSIINCLFNPER